MLPLSILSLSTGILFFHATATTEIYTLSLHDALPICGSVHAQRWRAIGAWTERCSLALQQRKIHRALDRKSTRLNSSHQIISYAVFCLKKKKKDGYQESAHTLNHARRDWYCERAISTR